MDLLSIMVKIIHLRFKELQRVLSKRKVDENLYFSLVSANIDHENK